MLNLKNKTMANVILNNYTMVDFPKYVSKFVQIINEKLSFHGMLKEKPTTPQLPPSQLHVTIHSEKMGYCYDGIKLIEKTFKQKGVDCKCNKFESAKINGKQDYSYEFILKIKK